jgi:hypothetical protein
MLSVKFKLEDEDSVRRQHLKQKEIQECNGHTNVAVILGKEFKAPNHCDGRRNL